MAETVLFYGKTADELDDAIRGLTDLKDRIALNEKESADMELAINSMSVIYAVMKGREERDGKRQNVTVSATVFAAGRKDPDDTAANPGMV